MNDEVIEQINELRFKLNQLIEEYKVLSENVTDTDKEKLEQHIKQLKQQTLELYQWFI